MTYCWVCNMAACEGSRAVKHYKVGAETIALCVDVAQCINTIRAKEITANSIRAHVAPESPNA